MRYKTYQRVLVITVPVVSIAILYFAAVFVIKHFTLPPCPTYYLFHIHCAGCGATRSVIALTNGNLFLAMRQNLSIPVLIVLGILYYLEFAFKVWGKRFRVPLLHNMKFMGALLVLWLAYSVARNFIPSIAPI